MYLLWENSLTVSSQAHVFACAPSSRVDERANDTVEQLTAPLDPSVSVGSLSISLDDELVVQQPMFPVEAVAEGNVWQRLSDQVLLWLE